MSGSCRLSSVIAKSSDSKYQGIQFNASEIIGATDVGEREIGNSVFIGKT
jgi:hypothetical protein